MEMTEDIRHTQGMKEIYQERRQTIERIFGTAKENHGFRYTQQYGKARMDMKAMLTFACMNLKKLAQIMKKKGLILSSGAFIFHIQIFFMSKIVPNRKAVLNSVV